ncbi:putative transposase-associated domain-containing protein [Tanacetum coccineum]|uniref:Transposase-associated domain-containing protein n=1 Tax=Tanacetum coccineum TaxID=301880 RepID=A0ABQ5HZX3_9ASTR
MPAYFTWTEHGETSIQDVRQSSVPMDSDDHDDLYDCRRMVMDSINGYSPTFQPHQDPHVAEDVPNPKSRKFYDLLKALDESLWEGCQNWTTLQAATSLLSWKSHCNVPMSTFNYILPIFKSMLPENNNLPDNFYAIKKSLDKLSIPSKRIDACKNHCMLFYGEEDKNLTHCRWCNESRYKSDQQNIPNLVLTYMPIGPRLQKLCMNKKTAKDMVWHHTHKTKQRSMAHPSDGKAWKHFDSINPDFAEEIRNVRLGLCTDGFSPNNSKS